MDDFENRETPFGGLQQEDVTSEEYERSREGLKRFLDVDVEEIQTLEDLSAKGSLVGHDLKTVIFAKGKIQEIRFEYPKLGGTRLTKAIYRGYMIEKSLGNYTISGTVTGDAVTLIRCKIGTREDEFDVRIPANGDIKSSGDGIIDDSSIHAIDWRKGQTKSYYPVKEPNNPKIQQGFARVLQDGVKDIVSILPSPSKVPEVFGK